LTVTVPLLAAVAPAGRCWLLQPTQPLLLVLELLLLVLLRTEPAFVARSPLGSAFNAIHGALCAREQVDVAW
jgi:hypothetical protein